MNKTTILVVAIVSTLSLPATSAAEPADPAREAESLFAQGETLVEQGNFRSAIVSYQKAAALFERVDRPKARGATLYNLTVAYHAVGNYKLAFETLDRVTRLAEDLEDEALTNRVRGLEGTISIFSRRGDAAEGELRASIDQAREHRDDDSLAWLLHDYGVLLAAQTDFEGALKSFEESGALALQLKLPELSAKVSLNRALMYLNRAAIFLRGNREFGTNLGSLEDESYQAGLKKAGAALAEASSKTAALDDSFIKAMMLITIGEGYHNLQTVGALLAENVTEKAFTHFQRGLTVAREIDNAVALSYAIGHLGRLYEDQKRYREALELTMRARFFAQKASWPDALYQWDWQIGRMLAATGQTAGALESYRNARQVLSGIRHDVAIGYGNRNLGQSFRDAVGNLYFELADLILTNARGGESDAELQDIYKEARLVIESFKSAELEDYFQDDCVNLALTKQEEIEEIASDTAVFYFIPLINRTEVLVSISGNIHRFTSDISAEKLNDLAYEFRKAVEADGDPSFFLQALPLYDHLVRPAESLLQSNGITTLVFVPDGSLRNIPMAALHDGEHFLIEKYAVAISPGLRLMEPKKIPRGEALMLVGALSESVRLDGEEFSELRSVRLETDAILKSIVPTPKLLMNENFLKKDFGNDVASAPFQIVHIASHGEFRGNAKDSFILTFDSKLNLNELEAVIRPREFDGKAVELLGLSACRTAAGDDRAALGLAGVALKSGARSAFATLWYVDDEASSMVVSSFYRRLAEDAGISKAEALRQAQLELLKDLRYDHPRAWAPYLIIGNWL